MANPKLLIHCNGTNGSTTFVDDAGHTVGIDGTVTVSTAQSKFGGGSASFGTTGAGQNRITVANHADFNVGLGDFTIHFWAYSTTASVTQATAFCLQENLADTYCPIVIGQFGTKYGAYASSGGAATGWNVMSLQVFGSVVANSWQHIAVVRASGTFYLFVNGVLGATNSASPTVALFNGAGPTGIGAPSTTALGWRGFLDEVVFYNGTALWTANFTPPTLEQVYGQDSVVASNFTASAASLAAPAVHQAHALSPSPLAAAHPTFGSPTVAQISPLTATSTTTGAVSFGAPAITQAQVLVASAFAAASPAFATPALAQAHALAATAITGAHPLLDAPALTQAHALVATGLAGQAASFGAPAMTQVHALIATGITTAHPVFGAPSLAQAQVLTASSLTAAGAAFPAVSIAQVHVLAGANFTTGPPAFFAPSIGQGHSLVATPLIGASPQWAQVINLLKQSRTFSVSPWTVSGATVLDNQALAPDGTMTAAKLTEGVANGVHFLNQNEPTSIGVLSIYSVHLKPNGRNWAFLQIGSNGAYFNLTGAGSLGSVGVGATAGIIALPDGTYRCSVSAVPSNGNRQVYPAAGNNTAAYQGDGVSGLYVWEAQSTPGTLPIPYATTTTNIATLGAPAMAQAHALSALGFTAGAASFGTPAAGIIVATVATSLTASPAAFGAPAIAQTHALAGADIATASPALGAPPIGQNQQLSAVALTPGAAILDAPALFQAHALVAAAFNAGSPDFGACPIEQVQALTPAAFAADAALFGAPGLHQVHRLTGADFATARPVFAAPVFVGFSNLFPLSFVAGHPAFGAPTLAQAQVLGAAPFAARSPVFDRPFVRITSHLVALPIAAAPAVIQVPTLRQAHTLRATALTAAHAAFQPPVVHQAHALFAPAFTTSHLPWFPPLLAQVHALACAGIAAHPAIFGPATVYEISKYPDGVFFFASVIIE